METFPTIQKAADKKKDKISEKFKIQFIPVSKNCVFPGTEVVPHTI